VSWSPGDPFLARYESADGVIRGALPLRVVGERSGYLATWVPAGTTVARPVLADGRGLRECSVEERYSLRASRVAPDGWEAWQPDPAWSQLELPEGWAA
jgi:hypothetical protein